MSTSSSAVVPADAERTAARPGTLNEPVGQTTPRAGSPAGSPTGPDPGSRPGPVTPRAGSPVDPSAGSSTDTPRRSSTDTPGSLTDALGVVGWSHLDPLLLGALALQAPVLLVGEHGTAKTLLVERVAAALDQEFRHYNASLVNYDDLVGIPIPDENGDLRFVGTAGAVWDAEFVFFDEVNRCRPDLQNKLFPIVHERRLAGQDLQRLRHRWAAMNPPSELDATDFGRGPDGGFSGGYFGAEPLDIALADRFWFVVRVPGWKDLSRGDRAALAAGTSPVIDEEARHDLAALLRRVAYLTDVAEAEFGAVLSGWAVHVADLLRGTGIVLSPRRVRVLVRATAATIAASSTLAPAVNPRNVAELTLRNALPCWADARPPSELSVVAAHVQAWELAEGSLDEVTREILSEPNAVRRIRTALRLGAGQPEVARTVTGALAAQPTQARRTALAVVVSRALSEQPLTPAAWSTVADLARPVLTPARATATAMPGPQLEAWRRATGLLADEDLRRRPTAPLERALVHGCGPALLAGEDPAALLHQFRAWCHDFGVV